MTQNREISIWIDGAEHPGGQGLVLLSVIHLAALSLTRKRIVCINALSDDLTMSAQATSFDTGLTIEIERRPMDEERLQRTDGASAPDVFLALAMETADHIFTAHRHLSKLGTVFLIAAPRTLAANVPLPWLPDRYAIDTALFARTLCHVLTRIEEGERLSEGDVSVAAAHHAARSPMP